MSNHGHGHRSTEEMIDLLLSPDRAERLDPLSVLSLSPVNPGETVADVGCGPGYFTLPLAKFLFSGKVYALDTDQEMLEACRRRLDEARMSNVETLLCQEYEFPVEAGILDGVLVAFVAHHPEDRVRFSGFNQTAAVAPGLVFRAGVAGRRDGIGPPAGAPDRTGGVGGFGALRGIPDHHPAQPEQRTLHHDPAQHPEVFDG